MTRKEALNKALGQGYAQVITDGKCKPPIHDKKFMETSKTAVKLFGLTYRLLLTKYVKGQQKAVHEITKFTF